MSPHPELFFLSGRVSLGPFLGLLCVRFWAAGVGAFGLDSVCCGVLMSGWVRRQGVAVCWLLSGVCVISASSVWVVAGMATFPVGGFSVSCILALASRLSLARARARLDRAMARSISGRNSSKIIAV